MYLLMDLTSLNITAINTFFDYELWLQNSVSLYDER